MDKVKEAFNKVRNDIDFLNSELNTMKSELENLRHETFKIVDILSKLVENQEKHPSKQPVHTSTRDAENSTVSTRTSTRNSSFNALKPQNLGISTRNGGVSTDRQTDRQTSRHTPISTENRENRENNEKESIFLENQGTQDSIESAAKILDSLDGIKKEIRIKFKQLTDQELLVFSTLYQLDEEYGHSDYRTLAKKLNLSESSIRDYISRLIKKGIPVEKTRLNNKYIKLNISSNLKKIASLPTILKLRDI